MQYKIITTFVIKYLKTCFILGSKNCLELSKCVTNVNMLTC